MRQRQLWEKFCDKFVDKVIDKVAGLLATTALAVIVTLLVLYAQMPTWLSVAIGVPFAVFCLCMWFLYWRHKTKDVRLARQLIRHELGMIPAAEDDPRWTNWAPGFIVLLRGMGYRHEARVLSQELGTAAPGSGPGLAKNFLRGLLNQLERKG